MKTKLRILIVEDSPDDALLAIHELERASYELDCERVETEGGLEQALKRKTWDAVLCDFTMPQFSGKKALHVVREADADLPFIYVSGTIGEDVAVEAMKSGANDYVLKNNLIRLVPAVERELRETKVRREKRTLEADRERLIQELRAALMDVKRLSGLLPMCARCQKIRNDRNEWQRLEIFIREHTEAQLTHSLCPDCVRRLYECPGEEDKLRDD